ncbi:unnamed protein product [Caenorhabditis auriculariae]|uniref:G protein-coupled receptor n=1 Tax=Caenorhabditis auriculariae TaxID=2777116 RepID=A0A8S1GU37_9PELO|nr:unnamed protein product [Caenorhabditis auriculariae]
MYAITLFILALHFIYRYLSVSRPRMLRFFTRRYSFIWVLLIVAIGANCFILQFYTLGPVPEVTEAVRAYIYQQYKEKIDELPYNHVRYFIVGEGGKLEFNIRQLNAIFGLVFCLPATMIASLLCGLKTWSCINNQLSVTAATSTIRLQRQLLYALLAQYIIPCFFNYIPLLVTFLSPAFFITLDPYTNAICSLIPYYPALDGIAVILIIKDYRTQLKCKSARPSGTGCVPVYGPKSHKFDPRRDTTKDFKKFCKWDTTAS